VAATSPSNAWAVGFAVTSKYSNGQTLIEHWNGTAWKVEPSPTPGDSGLLSGVAATSATNAWAVGYYSTGASLQPVIVHWDGTAWKRQPSLSPGGSESNNELFGVAATSATNASAVGFYSDPITQVARTLVEHWNGTSWRVQPSPNRGSDGSEFRAVAATSAANAWAVGHYYTGTTGVWRTLVEHWNGTAWSVKPSPNTGNRLNLLFGVAATSATNAWAVGYYSGPRTLVEHWNGTAWNLQPSPNPSASENKLSGVATTSASNAWVVGDYANSTADRTLALNWNGTAWRP
jgi:hypothetical protein